MERIATLFSIVLTLNV